MSNQALIGRKIADFQVLSMLGAGGMGAVYQALDVNLDKLVALKILPAASMNDPEAVERFRREAKSAARLEHPNIVPVYRFGEFQGLHYLAMRFVDGESLAERLERKTQLSLLESLFVVGKVAKGLQAAHESGLIHRDIKPANIMISKRGEVLVADFGLAKGAQEGKQGLTATGMILGTPDYMAPEQCEGLSDIDGRCDLFSLGLVLYAALSGKVPSFGKTPLQVLMNRVQKPIPAIQTIVADIPDEVLTLISGLLERDKNVRTSSAKHLLTQIRNLAIVKEAKIEGEFKLTDLPISKKVTPNDPTIISVTPKPLLATPVAKLTASVVELPVTKAKLISPAKQNLVSSGESPERPKIAVTEKRKPGQEEVKNKQSKPLWLVALVLLLLPILCCCLAAVLDPKNQ